MPCRTKKYFLYIYWILERCCCSPVLLIPFLTLLVAVQLPVCYTNLPVLSTQQTSRLCTITNLHSQLCWRPVVPGTCSLLYSLQVRAEVPEHLRIGEVGEFWDAKHTSCPLAKPATRTAGSLGCHSNTWTFPKYFASDIKLSTCLNALFHQPSHRLGREEGAGENNVLRAGKKSLGIYSKLMALPPVGICTSCGYI